MRFPSASGRDPGPATGPGAPRAGLGRAGRPPSGLRRARALLGGLALATMTLACTDTRGIVQIAWSFLDRSGTSVFPGALADSCSFHGALGGVDRQFDLQVAVRLCDPECPAGCGDESCLLVDPLVYSCVGTRGSSEVPSMDTPYEFRVDVLARLDDACTCVVEAPCAEVPGPRLRMVRPGLITDLQVYQLILDMASPTKAELALEGCCALPPECS